MRGQPKLIKRNDSPYWFIYEPKQGPKRARRLPTGQTTLENAQKVFAQWLLLQGKPELDEPEKIRMSDVLTKYEAYKSQDQTVGYHMRHLRPHFGGMALSHITDTEIQVYTEKRGNCFARRGKQMGDKLVSSGTIRRELDTLVAAIRYFTKKPFTVEKPKASKARQRWLTEDELERLQKSAGKGYFMTYLMIARHTAARPSSILDLKWFQVDFDARLIHFNPEDREQTKKYRPSVYINDDLLTHLRQVFATKKSEYVIATSKQGKHIGSIKRAFKAACLRAKIKGATPYTLRHTAITHIVRAGHGLTQAGQVAGHADPRTTLRYAHHDPYATKGAVQSLNANGAQLAHITPENARNEQKSSKKKANIQ